MRLLASVVACMVRLRVTCFDHWPAFMQLRQIFLAKHSGILRFVDSSFKISSLVCPRVCSIFCVNRCVLFNYYYIQICQFGTIVNPYSELKRCVQVVKLAMRLVQIIYRFCPDHETLVKISVTCRFDATLRPHCYNFPLHLGRLVVLHIHYGVHVNESRMCSHCHAYTLVQYLPFQKI